MRAEHAEHAEHRSAGQTDYRLIGVAALAAFVAAIVLFGAEVHRFAGFPLDDAWIHEVVGQNLAHNGVPSFAPGEAPSGSTSTLWPAIVALNALLFDFISPPVFLFAFNAAMLALSLAALGALAVEDRLPRYEAACLIILPALTGNFVWLATSGMEHSLFVAEVLLAAAFWTSTRLSPRVAAVVASTALGLAILTRVEAVAFVPIFLVAKWLMAGADRRSVTANLPSFLGPVIVATLLVMAINLWTTGTVLPGTMQGRRWLYFGPDAHPDIIGLLVIWQIRILRWFFGWSAGKAGLAAVLAVLLVINLCAALGFFSLWRLRARRTLFALALVLANLGMYAIVLPTPGHGGRYQALLMPFVLPLFGIGLIAIARRLAAWAPAVALAGVLAIGVNSTVEWARLTGDGIAHINATEVKIADWIRRNLPKDEAVASFDIGGIGRFSQHRIVDLGGLTDPGFVPHLYDGTVAAYLRNRSVVWLVLPTDPDHDESYPLSYARRLGLGDGDGLTKEKVVAFESAPLLWSEPYYATEMAARGQTLYRLHWKTP